MADDPFAPPPEDKRPLELEKDWAQEKAAKQATAQIHEPPRPNRGKLWIWVAIGVVVAGVLAAGIIVQLRANKHHGSESQLPATEGMVGIEIRAKAPAMITIDGHKAGKAPLTLHVRKGTTPVEISNGRQTKSVVPDHDQLIDFTR